MAKSARTTETIVDDIRAKLVERRTLLAMEMAKINEILSVVSDREGHEGVPPTVPEDEDVVPKVKHHLSKAARAKLSANMKKRWAERKAKGITSLKANVKAKKH